MRVLHDLGVKRIRHDIARLVAVIDDPVRAIDGDQHRVEVEVVEMRRTPADLRQEVGAPDHLIERPRADGGQKLPHLLRVEGDEVHHLVGGARELLAQALVLRADADGAGVGLALAHHDAAHRDQRGGADAVFLGPHHRRHDDIAPGAEPAIGAERHAVPQVVHGENLVRLGQAHLPRQTRVLDGRGRRGPGAAVMARDQDHVGLRLGHAGGDGADAEDATSFTVTLARGLICLRS
jgi:hypothetical protein